MSDTTAQGLGSDNAARQKSSPTKRLLMMVVIPLLAASGGGYFYLKGGQSVATDNAYVKADRVSISAEVSGTIQQVNVAENEPVHQGDVLFEIESAPFELAVQRAEAQLSQVATQLKALKVSYQRQKTELELAQSRYDYALSEEKRNQNLLTKNIISSVQFNAVQQSTRVASLQLVAAQDGLNQVLQSLGGSNSIPVEKHPDYLAAKSQLAQAQLNLSHTQIISPANGIVRIPPKVGQFIPAGQSALSIIENDLFWIEANYPEKDLTYVKPGQEVDIRIDTYPNNIWHGIVESLSPGTSAEFSILPAQNGTGNWVKVAQRVPVRIAIQPSDNSPELRAGLSSEVAISTGRKRSLMGLTLQ
jgi:membrane fusion protein, multidrug efflux system